MPCSTIRAAIILLLTALQGGCHTFAPPPETAIATGAPVYVEGAAPVIVAPVVTQPGLQGGVPSFPDPLAPTGPPAFAPPALGDTSGAIAPQFGLPVADMATPGMPNPMKIPVSNHDFAWDQIVDVISDYFPIAREQRVHIDQQVWTEGRVETSFQVAATMFEPQRKDSVGAFNLWQSTLQTIRRRAVVRVVPERRS